LRSTTFLPAFVRTYNAGLCSSCCFVVVGVVVVETLIRILH
jgi:hypothetical protein